MLDALSVEPFAEKIHHLRQCRLRRDVVSADDADPVEVEARLITPHLDRPRLALRHVEDDESAVDGFLQAVDEPLRRRRVARAEGLHDKSFQPRRLQSVPHELRRDAREQLQDADVGVEPPVDDEPSVAFFRDVFL